MGKAFIDEAEDVARISLESVREYLNYSGSNKEYLQRAKVAATMIASYTRHFASLTNREMLKLAQQKQSKALPGAK